MFIALVIVTIALALFVGYSAVAKFRHDEKVVRPLTGTIGVSPRAVPALATLELVGAVGVVVGLGVEALGIAAAVGLTVFFIGAVISHVRVGDIKGVAAPALPLLLSVAALVLRIVTR